MSGTVPGLLEGFRFLPAGRIQRGRGTPHQVTLFNCFVMGVIEDRVFSKTSRSARSRCSRAAA
jgi:hypothetical protein